MPGPVPCFKNASNTPNKNLCPCGGLLHIDHKGWSQEQIHKNSTLTPTYIYICNYEYWIYCTYNVIMPTFHPMKIQTVRLWKELHWQFCKRLSKIIFACAWVCPWTVFKLWVHYSKMKLWDCWAGGATVVIQAWGWGESTVCQAGNREQDTAHSHEHMKSHQELTQKAGHDSFHIL